MTAVLDSTLTGAQAKALLEVLEERTTKNEMAMILNYEMDIVLEQIVDTGKNGEELFSDLIEYFRRRSKIREFADAICRKREDLKVELDEIINDRSTPRLFRAKFEERIGQLDCLNVFKLLHDALHTISSYSLEITNQASIRLASGTRIDGSMASILQDAVSMASDSAAQLKKPNPHAVGWIPGLKRATEAFLGEQSDKHETALRYIVALPGKMLPFLNEQIVECARHLDLESLMDLLNDPLVVELGIGPAVENFKKHCKTMTTLACDHDLCQKLADQLDPVRYAEACLPSCFIFWDDMEQWFNELLKPREMDHAKLRMPRDRTFKAVSEYRSSPSKERFDGMLEKFDYFFLEVDKTLLTYVGQFVIAGIALQQALRPGPRKPR